MIEGLKAVASELRLYMCKIRYEARVGIGVGTEVGERLGATWENCGMRPNTESSHVSGPGPDATGIREKRTAVLNN